jgi:hypothetical protein
MWGSVKVRSRRESEGAITMKVAQVLVALSLVCLGCSTSPEVTQALIAKGQGYAENQRLMEQYRELVTNFTEWHHQWYRYVQTRLKLNLALQWPLRVQR